MWLGLLLWLRLAYIMTSKQKMGAPPKRTATSTVNPCPGGWAASTEVGLVRLMKWVFFSFTALWRSRCQFRLKHRKPENCFLQIIYVHWSGPTWDYRIFRMLFILIHTGFLSFIPISTLEMPKRLNVFVVFVEQSLLPGQTTPSMTAGVRAGALACPGMAAV